MWRDFINLIFPCCCLICKKFLVKSENKLCTTCFSSLPETDYHLEENNPAAQKFYGRVPIKYAMGLYKFRTGNGVQKLLHQLKYNHKPEIGEWLGKIYGSYLVTQNLNFDCIIPVPLHRDRLLQRGYNQSEYFGRGMTSLLQIPCYGNGIQRVKNTATQTKGDRVERLSNLADAFYVPNTSLIEKKHVLLVDDIITTGATLEACALPLLAQGAKEVSIATIAVAD